MNLSDVATGQKAVIKKIGGKGAFRKRILEMGFIQGKVVTVVQNAPFKDPVYYRIMDYNVSLRRKDAALIEVSLYSSEEEGEHLHLNKAPSSTNEIEMQDTSEASLPAEEKESYTPPRRINVALVGNPNCGKTSLFNLASGAHEHVGNYSGVTVDAKEAYFKHKGCRIDIVDLPGSYSLSPYSPEELFIRNYLTDPATRPDVVIDVIDTCNLERNLYLTLQIKEMNLPLVVALNMFDEFEKSMSKLNVPLLSQLLDTPMIPTVGRVARGIKELFDAVIAIAEKKITFDRDIRVPYGTTLEPAIENLTHSIATRLHLPNQLPDRYIAIKLLEKDVATIDYIHSLPNGIKMVKEAEKMREDLDKQIGNTDTETLITDQRYGFIAGALRETYQPERRTLRTLTDKLDHALINPKWGFPIFLLFLLVMFECTFMLGAYPQEWIEMLVDWIAGGVGNILHEGPLKDLITDGVIQGVGGVIVFLPQILILYLFISIMEDTGYMARAAFMMDKLMHKMGLHGKSFIPLIMGFGCNVPAIMATRTIESRQSRLITILVTPLMSCSARLPVYVLIAGAFFGAYAGVVLFSVYLVGILLAVLLARLFRKALFTTEDVPFVMELPPYRLPTAKSVLIHMWEKAKEYLQKMGTIILAASIIIWFLGYFPREEIVQQTEQQIETLSSQWSGSEEELAEQIEEIETLGRIEQQENSYLGKMGKGIEPLLSPLGFDWKMSIALVSGLPAKEVVVSTLGVIYTGDGNDSEEASSRLTERIKMDRNEQGDPTFTPLIALSFMLFVLLYFPCIATVIAVGREAGSPKWGLFLMVYTCVLAWVVSFIVYQTGSLLGWG